MGSLANLLSKLQSTTNGLVTNMATDSFFVLRATKTPNGKGGTTKDYQPTTTTAIPCFYAPVTDTQIEREQMRAGQRRPGVFFKFTTRSDVDITEADRIRLVDVRGVGEREMEVLRVTPQVGLALEIVAFEEAQLS